MRSFGGVGFPKKVSVRSDRFCRLKREHTKSVIWPPLPGVPLIAFSLGFLAGEESLALPPNRSHPLPLLRAAPLANGAVLPGGVAVPSLEASGGLPWTGKALT